MLDKIRRRVADHISPRDTHGHDAPRSGDVFVLSGGGAAGAAQAGMILALMRAGVVPSAVVGCSAGALNAAAIACDPTLEGAEQLVETWRGLTGSHLLSGSIWSVAQRIATRKPSLVDRSDLEAVVERWFAGTGVADLSQAKLACHVITTRLPDGQPTWHTSGPVRDILLASSAVPGLLPPVRLPDGSLHIDGGVVDLVPVHKGLSLNPERVWVLDVTSAGAGMSGVGASWDLLTGAFQLAVKAQRFARGEAEADERVNVIRLPKTSGGASLRDFHLVPKMLQLGQDAAELELAAQSLWPVPAAARRSRTKAVPVPRHTLAERAGEVVAAVHGESAAADDTVIDVTGDGAQHGQKRDGAHGTTSRLGGLARTRFPAPRGAA